MRSTPLISIIVPVFNAEVYLVQCLDSILLQSFEHFELLLINDGSVDNSGSICNSYSTKDDRVRVFHMNNRGVSSARNIGIEEAKGEWIVFVDSDDFVVPNFLEKLTSPGYLDEYDLIGGNYYLFSNGSYSPRHRIDSSLVFDESGVENIALNCLYSGYYRNVFGVDLHTIPIWNKMYKREIIRNQNIRFNEAMIMSEDALFNIHYLKHCNSAIFLMDSLYCYRVSSDSTINRYIPELFEEYKKNISIFQKEIVSNWRDTSALNACLSGRMIGYLRDYASRNLLSKGLLGYRFFSSLPNVRELQLLIASELSRTQHLRPVIGLSNSINAFLIRRRYFVLSTLLNIVLVYFSKFRAAISRE